MKKYIICKMHLKPTNIRIRKFYEEIEMHLAIGHKPVGGLNTHKGVIFQLFLKKEEGKKIIF